LYWAPGAIHARLQAIPDFCCDNSKAIEKKKGTHLCAPGKAWSLGIDGAIRHEMA
jgi:hypothetical protein